MQPTLSRLTLALALAFTLPGLALAQAAGAGAKIATVNGVAIPKSRVDAIVRAQVAQGQKDTPELRAAIGDRLITLEVLAQAAKLNKLDKSADTVAQIDIARSNILAQVYHTDYLKRHPVSEDAMKAEYEKIKSNMGDKEYKARHILVEKESDAKDIIEKLKKGEKFEELAKVSKDAGSKDKGGDLDWNLPSGFVKPFADAMVKLGKGKYTETPVKSQFGWHVIELEDVRPATFPGYEQVKPKVQQRLQQEMFEKVVTDLRAKAKVE
ncbi:MAG: peptidylprolyl isomerase [Burkholderiales bacterium]|nr:peptidylprolyl isomerase [Burkholderiales bacterium]